MRSPFWIWRWREQYHVELVTSVCGNFKSWHAFNSNPMCPVLVSEVLYIPEVSFYTDTFKVQIFCSFERWPFCLWECHTFMRGPRRAGCTFLPFPSRSSFLSSPFILSPFPSLLSPSPSLLSPSPFLLSLSPFLPVSLNPVRPLIYGFCAYLRGKFLLSQLNVEIEKWTLYAT